jgi:predicted nucleotidyltransferase
MATSQRAALRLVSTLVRAGYLKESKIRHEGWTTTTKGQRLAIANAAPQIYRSTATKLLNGLVTRMKTLETHRKFIYRVSEAFVFGSYTTNAERLSDVDVAFRLRGLAATNEEQFELSQARVRDVDAYRTFRNFSGRLSWPYYEVLRFLRNRSGYVELHNLDDEESVAALRTLVRIYPSKVKR